MAGPHRLIVVAVGISDYVGDPGLVDIACAPADARLLYETLSRSVSEVFDQAHSVLYENLAAHEFRDLVEAVARTVEPSDLMLVYFSGHGEYDGGTVALAFADAGPDGRGRLTSSEIAASSRQANAVFVLDCCSSGGALHLANQVDPILAPRVSVIASARLSAAATYGETGSAFTLSLCRAIDLATDSGEDLTVQHLAAAVGADDSYTGECLVNIAEGESDVVVASKAREFRAPANFTDKFLSKMTAAPADEREMLWYSLSGLPIPMQVDVLDAWSGIDDRPEPSWLVRRATGSTLGALPSTSAARQLITSRLLESASWMDATVGVIAARRSVHDLETANFLRQLATSGQVMDLVWLAHLYLADASSDHLSASLDTALPETDWGAVELWERYCRDRNRDEATAAVESLSRRVAEFGGDDVLRAVATHARLRGQPSEQISDIVDDELLNDPLAVHLYSLPGRGQVVHPAGKWLLSALYGSWRDQVDARLEEVASTKTARHTTRSLELASRLPSVALRMALFQDASALTLTSDAAAALQWGLEDPHPWVRRTAVEAFGLDSVERATSEVIDRRRFPGMLDLLLTCRRLGFESWREYAERHELTPIEVRALKKR